MDIISSINTAFTQIQRDEHMTLSSSGGHTRQQIQQESRAGQPGGPRLGQTPPPPPGVEGERSPMHNAVSYDRSQNGALELRTQEGDIVRLNFVNTESSNAQNQQFENGGTMISGFSMDGGSSSNFSVVVDGDLNGQELSAIRDVLIQAREIANSFYDGNVKAAFNVASELKIDSDQLANVSMKLTLEETYTYAQAPAVAQNPNVALPSNLIQPVEPAVDSNPSMAPVNVQTQSAGVNNPVSQPDLAAIASVTSPEPNAIAPNSPEPLQTAVHVEPDAVNPLASALSTINDFLNQISESLDLVNKHLQNMDTPSPFGFTNGFQLQLVGILVGQMESPSADEPPTGHTLASATIDKLAMKMDAHVNDVA